MRIHVPDALAHQRSLFDEPEDFAIGRLGRGGQRAEQFKHTASIVQAAASELADDEGMSQNIAEFQSCSQGGHTAPKMIDPDRGIDQNHAATERRRGTGRKPGSVPPRRASRRALSR